MLYLLGPLTLGVLILPGIALLWTSRLVYGKRGAASDDALKRIMATAGYLLLLIGLFGVIVGLTGPLSVFSVFVLPIVLIMVVGQYRQAERRTLMATLAVAAERGIPLDVAARAFAAERNDELGLRAERLSESLAAGVPLPEALRATGHPLPVDALVAVRVGTGIGELGPALRRIGGQNQSPIVSLRSLVVDYLYVLWIANFALFVVTFLMLKIVPVFGRMFSEFELPLPAPTMLLVALANQGVKYGLLLAPIYVLFFVTLVAGILNYMGLLPRGLPIVRRFTMRYDGAVIMRALSLAVEQHRSLVEMLRFLSLEYPLAHVRTRLRQAVAAIDHGADWCDALVRVSLILPADAAVLKAAQRAGNLDWALVEMADSSLRRSVYRWRAYFNLVAPLAILAMGSVVAFIVISLFMPLVSMIVGLSR